jgi:PilZ domain
MQERDTKTDAGQRQAPRFELDGQVTIQFDASLLAGSGQNISAQGVFFTAAAALPVTVLVAGHGEVKGHLVRVESMGDGRIGVAVRFDAPHPELVS